MIFKLCGWIQLTFYLLDGFLHVPIIFIYSNDKSPTSLRPDRICVGIGITSFTCENIGSRFMHTPFVVGRFKKPLPRLPKLYSKFFQFVIQFLCRHAYFFCNLSCGKGIHTLQVVVVVADFGSGFFDFLCLNLNGDLLLFGFGLQVALTVPLSWQG